MAETTFLFGGVHSKDDLGLRVEKVHRPILPPTRARRLVIPTRHGEWDFGSYYGPRPISFDCWVAESTRAALLTQAALIATAIDVVQGYKRLIISDDTANYWNAKYDGALDIEVLVGYGTFKLPFICSDPFSHPLSGTIIGSGAGITSLLITNTGSALVPCHMELVNTSGGMLSSFSITIGTRTLTLQVPFLAGSTLIVDSAQFTATLAGVSVVGSLVGQWPVILPGINTIAFSGAVDATVEFTPAS